MSIATLGPATRRRPLGIAISSSLPPQPASTPRPSPPLTPPRSSPVSQNRTEQLEKYQSGLPDSPQSISAAIDLSDMKQKIIALYTAPSPRPHTGRLILKTGSLEVSNALIDSLPERIHPRYHYTDDGKLIVFQPPGRAHESFQSYFNRYWYFPAIPAVKDAPSALCFDIQSLGSEARSLKLPGNDKRAWRSPDCGFKILYRDGKNTTASLLMVEVGVSELYSELVKDAKDWLQGSKKIHAVLLVKLVVPRGADSTSDVRLWKGFCQLWHCHWEGEAITFISEEPVVSETRRSCYQN